MKTQTNENILAAAQLNPTISTKQLEKECELSRRSILRILYENKFHPYHIHSHQNLKEPDFVSHMNFCNIMLRMIEDPTFLSRVLFSDEANFCNNGQVNRHNMHYWAMENSYWMRTVPFQCP